MSFVFLGSSGSGPGSFTVAWSSGAANLDPDSMETLTMTCTPAPEEDLVVPLSASLPSGATLSASTLTIPANATSSTVTLLGDPDLFAGSGVVSIVPAAGIALGSPSAVTVTTSGQVSVLETTRVFVAEHRAVGGGNPRRQVQLLAAIVPPVANFQDLQGYALSTGERVQCVRMSRLGGDLIDSCYVYGYDDGGRHMPDDATPLILRPIEAGDVNPAEDGQFTAAPDLEFELEVANVGELLRCSTSDFMAEEQWTGPASQRFDQVGPNLCLEKAYQARPHKAAASGPQADLLSGDGIGELDWQVRSIAGDPDVFLVEGRFINAAYDSAEDVQQTNSKADGRIHLKSLRVNAPAGWIIDPGPFPSPVMGATPAQQFTLVKSRSTSYLMRPAHRFGFWFVVRRQSAGVAAQERGVDYLLGKNIGWAVGGLGPTRQPIYGDHAECTLDYARAGFTLEDGPNLSGWEAIEYLGENIAGLQTGFQGYGSEWRGGGAHPETAYDVRRGMWHTASGTNMGPAGFSGRHGMGALLPHWGWWDRVRYMLEYGAQRMHRSMRDVSDGSAAWWWRALRVGNVEAGQVGAVASIGYNAFRVPLWTFNLAEYREDNRRWWQNPGWIQGPTDRAHNLPEILDDLTLVEAVIANSKVTEVIVAESIPAGTPQVGTIMMVSNRGSRFGLSYTSWSGSTFTLTGNYQSQKSSNADFSEEFDEGSLVQTSLADVDYTAIENENPLSMTHLGYMRTPLVDGVYCCRRYNAYRDWEELAAYASRCAIPHTRVAADAAGDQSTTNLIGGIGGILTVAESDGPFGASEWYQTGEFVSSSTHELSASTPSWATRSSTPGPIRGYARLLQFMHGFSAIADQTQRDNLLGKPGSEAYIASGTNDERKANTIGRLLDFLEYVTTPAGCVGQSPRAGQPPPFSVGTLTSKMIAPDYTLRIGAGPTSYDQEPDKIAAMALTFHQGYMGRAMGGALKRAIPPGDPRQTANDRLFLLIENYVAGREAIGLTQDGWDNWPYYIITQLSDYPSSLNGAGAPSGNGWSGAQGKDRAPDVVSLSRVRAGEMAWAFRRAGGGPDGTQASEDHDYYGQLHRWKVLGMALHTARQFDDYAWIERYVGKVFSLSGSTAPQQLLEYFLRASGPQGDSSLEAQLSNQQGSPAGDEYQYADTSMTISVGLMAHCLNKYT